MSNTRDLPAIAWSGFCVYGDDKSIEKVRGLIIDADSVPGLKDQIARLQQRLKAAEAHRRAHVAAYHGDVDGDCSLA